MIDFFCRSMAASTFCDKRKSALTKMLITNMDDNTLGSHSSEYFNVFS